MRVSVKVRIGERVSKVKKCDRLKKKNKDE